MDWSGGSSRPVRREDCGAEGKGRCCGCGVCWWDGFRTTGEGMEAVVGPWVGGACGGRACCWARRWIDRWPEQWIGEYARGWKVDDDEWDDDHEHGRQFNRREHDVHKGPTTTRFLPRIRIHTAKRPPPRVSPSSPIHRTPCTNPSPHPDAAHPSPTSPATSTFSPN